MNDGAAVQEEVRGLIYSDIVLKLYALVRMVRAFVLHHLVLGPDDAPRGGKS